VRFENASRLKQLFYFITKTEKFIIKTSEWTEITIRFSDLAESGLNLGRKSGHSAKYQAITEPTVDCSSRRSASSHPSHPVHDGGVYAAANAGEWRHLAPRTRGSGVT
jgi:hypothetical protein